MLPSAAGIETPVFGYPISSVVVPFHGVVILTGGLGSNLQHEVRQLAALFNGVNCRYVRFIDVPIKRFGIGRGIDDQRRSASIKPIFDGSGWLN